MFSLLPIFFLASITNKIFTNLDYEEHRGYLIRNRNCLPFIDTLVHPVVFVFGGVCVALLLKSTCDVNLLSKLSIIFKEWRVMNNADRGRVIVLFVL